MYNFKVLELIGKEDIKLSNKQVDELLELLNKEEILEEKEQSEKLTEKDASELKDGNCTDTKYVSPKSPVPATPVTTEKSFGKEELEETAEESNKSFATHSSEQEKEKSTAVLKSNSNNPVRNPPLTPGVPPPTKKAEGSKQL